MEDASGTDLDWFWRGWFYTTDAVDISIDGISEYGVSTKDPEKEKAWKKAQKDAQPISLSRAAQQVPAEAPGRASGAEGLLQRARRVHGHQQGPQHLRRSGREAGAVGEETAGSGQAPVPGGLLQPGRPGDAADPGD
jgi:hypothetical protein